MELFSEAVSHNFSSTMRSANIQQVYRGKPIPTCDFKKNIPSAWVLYCRFAADLQNTFLEKYLWGTASVFHIVYFGASNK